MTEYLEISYNGGSNWSVLQINNSDGLWSK